MIQERPSLPGDMPSRLPLYLPGRYADLNFAIASIYLFFVSIRFTRRRPSSHSPPAVLDHTPRSPPVLITMPNDAPNNDDSSSILAPPPRAHSERAQFTDYRRAGEHRDIQRFRDSQRTGSSLTELAAAARHHSHRQRGSHDFQHLRRHDPRGGPDQERDRHHRRRRRHRSDDFDPLVDKFSAKVNLLCCVFHPTQHRWSTAPVCFDRVKHDDCDVWYLIRDVYRGRLQPAWRRWLGFKKLVAIVPIVVSAD